MRRSVCRPLISLLLAIAPILTSNRSSAQVQEPLPAPQTPHLIFSTYLGGSLACATCPGRTFAQNAASDAQGNTYVTGATECPMEESPLGA